ncbi:MAG: DsbA family protein [Oscillospiraceae bacterium]|jgi:predicted DsbA family dithiol-disulfide isomerase|nr:DsbA family protein [Oscillospiraceae bacterium]
MRTLKIFYDYACPYCLRGHEYLLSLIQDHPDIQVAWHPCEAHPRPEQHGPHTDLCMQGMYFARDAGADLWAYHALTYKAALQDRVDIEDAASLAKALSGLLDEATLRQALQSGRYAKEVQAANDLAYEQCGVWAVPAYRMDGKRLDAAEGVGVTRQQLAAFLRGE